MGLQLQLEYPNPTGIMHDSEEVITAEKLKAELRRSLEQKTWEVVHEQSWQGKPTCMSREDMTLNFNGCFWWLSGWKQCLTHTMAGMFARALQAVITYEVVCQPENAHGHDGRCDVQAM